MRERLQLRLDELRREREAAQERLKTLEAEAARTRETLLRITGAIQVLEETLADEAPDAGS